MSITKPINNSDKWYEFSSIHLECLNPKVDLEPEKYVKGLINRAKLLNSDTLAFLPDSGDLLLYPGTVAPMDSHIKGVDLFGMVEKEAHKHNLKFVAAFFGIQGRSYLSKEYPEWSQLDYLGNPKHFYNSTLLCPNSPFSNYYCAYIEEVISKYKIDGIYVEGIYINPGFCYCNYCREKFKFLYNRDVPKEYFSYDNDYTEFRHRSFTNVYRKIREVINKVSKNTVFFGCVYYPGAVNLKEISQYVDVVVSEQQWGYWLENSAGDPRIVPFWQTGLQLQLLKSEGKKPVNGTTWVAKHVDYNFASRGITHFKLCFMEILSHQAAPQIHTQTEFENDMTLFPVLTGLFEVEKKIRPYLMDAEILPYIAILNHADSNDVSRMEKRKEVDMHSGVYADNFLKGYYRVLNENHLSTTVITPDEVLSGRLDKYKVLVLPNVLCISDDVAEKIKEFVKNGGGLVFTYQSGWYDEKGNKRERPALYDLVGIKDHHNPVFQPSRISPIVPFLHIYYKITNNVPCYSGLKGKLCSFNGSYLEIEVEEQKNIIAEVVDFDYSRMHSDHLLKGAYPGRTIGPLVVNNQIGKGRVVYFACDLDQSSYQCPETESMDMLYKSVLWAGNDNNIPLKTNCPASVEVVAYQKKNNMIIFLVNTTTNQLGPGWEPIRYVVPVQNIKMELRASGFVPKNVSAINSNVKYKIKEHKIEINIDKLDEYEILIIQ